MYTFQSSGHFNFTTEMDSSNSLVLNFAFPCGLRGFHVYKDPWVPKLNEKLETIHEETNPHDRYAVAAIRKTVSRTPTTGNLKVYKVYHSTWRYCESKG